MPDEDFDTRAALLEALLDKVEEDGYPSSTMLDTIEGLLTPRYVQRYAEVLLRGIRESSFPSISMIHRLEALAA